MYRKRPNPTPLGLGYFRIVKAIFSEGFTETLCTGVYFSVNGFTKNAEAIFYLQ